MPAAVAGLAFLGALCPGPSAAQHTGPKVSWHWHMHQPIYWNDQNRQVPVDRYEYAWESIQQTDAGAPNPENNLRDIFGKDDRVAAYQYRMRDAMAAIGGAHPNSGVATSYTGALMENVDSLGQANQLGYSPAWADPIGQANGWTTVGGHTRMDIVGISYHHALTGLHNPETIAMELKLHQEKVKEVFGPWAVSRGYFPTEMTFSVRQIPTLKELGIEWVIVSGEHIARACPDFPVQLGSGGVMCAPPNRADQVNPNGEDFIRVSIDRGNAPVNANPLSYQPAYAKYVDAETGEEHKIIVVPADMAQGWRDGYACIDAGFLDAVAARNDPAQPSLVLLSHDGDNAFGGGFSYYNECVTNLANDVASRGGEVTSIEQYLAAFPPDPGNVIHVEDGGWAYADSDFGSPSYINWNYPLLDANGQVDPVNGWHEKPRDMAIFTEALNRVLTAQQVAGDLWGYEADYQAIMHPGSDTHPVDRAWHYYLGSLDSGNVYYGPVLDLEVKATIGANEAFEHADPIIAAHPGEDRTPPTIWLPQRFPYNPGGLNFGVEFGYREVIDDGDFHIWTFIADTSGPVQATLYYRVDADGVNPLDSNQNETFAGGDEVGDWVPLAMAGRDFPRGMPPGYSNGEINFFELPEHIARHYSVEVTGLRDVLIDYFVEATDARGNTSRSPIQHVYIGTGEGSAAEVVTADPDPPVRSETVTVTYDASGRVLDGAAQVFMHHGFNNWDVVYAPDPAMTPLGGNRWQHAFVVDGDAEQLDFVFNDGAGTWDNNGGADWRFATTGTPSAPVADFVASPLAGPAPLDVSFTDLSAGGPASWAWDFDNDGLTDSTERNPSFQYETPGTYSVSLTVTNAQGSDTATRMDYITVSAPPDGPVLSLDKSHISAVATVGQDAEPDAFTVRNAGSGVLEWTATVRVDGNRAGRAAVPAIVDYLLGHGPATGGMDRNSDGCIDVADIITAAAAPGAGWLRVDPDSGTSTGEANVAGVYFDSAGLDPGEYTALIEVAANADNSPQQVSVTLAVGDDVPSGTSVDPDPPVAGESVRVWYVPGGGPLAGATAVNCYWGIDGWDPGTIRQDAMTAGPQGTWRVDLVLPASARELNFVFNDGADTWDNNNGQDWAFPVVGAPDAPLIQVGPGALSVTVPEGSDAPPVDFTVRNAGTGVLEYFVNILDTGDGTDWLSVAPSSGESSGLADTVRVSFATAALDAGTRSADLQVAGNAANSPVLLPVSVQVTPAAAARPITIGRGPLIGTNTEGVSYYEEFQDWTAADLRALDWPGDATVLGDGYDGSRDLVAFYSRFEAGNLYLRVDLHQLGIFAEDGFLDIYVLVDCADGGATDLPNGLAGSATRPWNLAVATYDVVNHAVLLPGGGEVADGHLGAYFRSDLDAVEFGVTQEALRQAGWDGSSAVHFEVFTARDFGAAPVDWMDYTGPVSSSASTGRAKFATIAHGNQSLNRTDPNGGLRDRLYISGADTGTGEPSGFRLTLDTHTIFQVPLNVHVSATLVSGIAWIVDDNPVWDGRDFLQAVGRIVDADQDRDPGAMIGGVYAEHIMPFFAGPVNMASMDHFEDLTRSVWGLEAADMRVMHVPERVADSLADRRDLFDDIAESDYVATVLDEVAHIRDWLYPGDPWTGIGGEYGIPRQHKIHRINGVLCFLINDNEDHYKFWPQGEGAHEVWRTNLLYKAMDSDQSQLTLIFDDWEALAGWSFASGYNNNAQQYNTVMRWVANRPWIEVVTLDEILARATDPAHPLYDPGWIIEQGHVGDQPMVTYDYLQHATGDSYENWYWGSEFEESFRNAVPVIDGRVGAGTPLPSAKIFGDIDTPGTIIHDTWQAIEEAPRNNLRRLAELAFMAMIYETAWHDEDNTDYERDPATNHTTWLYPDTTFDRVSDWAYKLHNHLRGATVTVAAAHWADSLARGVRPAGARAEAIDLDQDGQPEYVLSNERMWLAFEARGGRCVQAFYFDPATGDAISFLGSSPINNPAFQGEEEGTSGAGRCSAFKDMNQDAYADVIYSATAGAGELVFTSPDSRITKTFTLAGGSRHLRVNYQNNIGADLYTRLGVSVNNLDLLDNGRNIDSSATAAEFVQVNRTRGSVTVSAGTNAAINMIDAAERFAIPLTEQVEVALGQGASDFTVSVPGP